MIQYHELLDPSITPPPTHTQRKFNSIFHLGSFKIKLAQTEYSVWCMHRLEILFSSYHTYATDLGHTYVTDLGHIHKDVQNLNFHQVPNILSHLWFIYMQEWHTSEGEQTINVHIILILISCK